MIIRQQFLPSIDISDNNVVGNVGIDDSAILHKESQK